MNRSEYADRIRRAIQSVLAQNCIDYSTFVVSQVPASPDNRFRWRVVALTARGKISLEIETTAFDSDELLLTKSADAVARSLPLGPHADWREHTLVYCWCGHSGDTPVTEKGSHYFRTPSSDPSRRLVSQLDCHDCKRHPYGLDEKRQRPRPLPCPLCHGGYVRDELCTNCNGMGYLKPAWYVPEFAR